MTGERSQLLRWLLVLPAALSGFLVGQLVFVGIRALAHSHALLSPLGYGGWLISDCLASALFIIFGTRTAPSRRFGTALGLSAVVATWHGVLLGANPFGPISEEHSEAIVLITCVTGLIISAVLCYQAYLGERKWTGSELKAYLPELPEAMPEPGPLLVWEPTTPMLPTSLTYKPVENDDSVFLASDLVLLERELLKIEPCTESYISALKLGIAIEQDKGCSNLEGECFSFAQLMRDLAMRLSVRAPDEKMWLEIASIFWNYSNQAEEERKQALDEVLGRLSALTSAPFDASLSS